MKTLFIILSLLLSSLICQDFGDGSDGDLLVDSTTIINNTITIVSANCYYGFDYLLVEDVTGFNVGDEILIITSEDLTSNIHSEISTGNFDFFMIVNVYEGIIYLDSTLTKNYLSDNRIHQVIKVPNYSNLTITEEGEIIANAWNGNNGGIISFKVSGTLVNNGKINVDGMGYRGGESVNTLSIPGNNGEGINGGSGGSPQNNDCYCHGGGGGGLSEMLSSDVCVSPNGQIVGDEEMLLLFFGGGGGSGSRSSWSQSPNGEGGAGGGIIFISSQTIINNGIISANGIDGTAGIDHRMCSGGSGAGGSIFLDSEQFNNFGIINSFGGEYVEAGSYNGGWATGIDIADGGEGSDGRIRIDYSIGNIGNIEPEPYLLPVPGCTHPNATNYDETANVDDGSCEYETVQIGHQVWMSENLKATHYRNGDEIQTNLTSIDFGSTTEGAYTIYDNNPSNADIYGNLYNWHTVDDERGVCPENYHVPSDDEWKEMELFLGMSEAELDGQSYYRGSSENVGGKLKGIENWWSPNNGANNQSGFNAFAGGWMVGYDGTYLDLMKAGVYWTSSEYDNDIAWRRLLWHQHTGIKRETDWKTNGQSIRCLSDELQNTTILVPENFAIIQEAIDYSIDGDTILVSAGTYYENINFNGKNIALIGEDRETTIIDGGQNGSVVSIVNGENETTVLSNFTLINGDSYQGGGISCIDSSPQLSNLIIKNNNAAVDGGGIRFASQDFVIEPILKNSIIINNTVSNTGSFEGNHYLGGGIACAYQSSPTIINCTVVNNSAQGNGGGLAVVHNSTPTFKNSIIYNNSSPNIYIGHPNQSPQPNLNFIYSNVYNEVINEINGTINWLNSIIDINPQLNEDFTLQSTSPCIDAGDPNSPLDPDGTRADMGAYPYEQYQNSINLHEGANLISFYAIPKDNSVSNVLLSLGDNAEGIIGEGVAASKVGDTWVGSLTEIESTSGYWLKLGSSAELNLTGFPLAGENELYTLHEGANLISYPYESDNAISSAIPDLFEGYIEGIIGEGVAAVQTAPGNWVGSLTEFERNGGYWLKSSSSFTFAYDPPSEELARSIANTMDKDFNQSTEQAFYFIEDIENIEVGDIVSAYCNDTKVGSRQWNGAYTDIPAMGNDNSDLTKDYCTSNQAPTFRVEKLNGKTYALTGDIPVWESNGLHMLSSLQEAIILPESYSLAAAYPNPFNPTTTINFAIPADTEVSISVYNLQGREVVSLANQSYDAGYHSVVWNADTHSSGVYFVKMVAGSYVNTQKLMLVK